ncbi:MAG: response regulator transcription factor [Prevotella sp.]|nr:response regulator transcription factor [Prevotella sp.]
MKEKILIVDDEQDLCEILQFNLAAAGYAADYVLSAEKAAEVATGYDLLLLDVMLGGMSGFELARQLKCRAETAHISIIFLTAMDTVDDTVEGLNIGADDYIPKPFSVKEVVARVRAVLRRRMAQGEAFLRHGGLLLDIVRKLVTIDSEQVELTKTEFDLLKLLMSFRGQVFSREQLMERIWQGVVVTDRTIDVNITRLRKKIRHYSRNIATRQGFGYYFDEQIIPTTR